MPLKTHLDEQPSINLTSMIDIVFLIIIFFMVGAEFTEMERDISLHVPEVSDIRALAAAPEKKVINVFGDGRISLDDQFVTLGALEARLAAAKSEYADLGVVVRGDSEGRFQEVASVLNACRKAGISDMGISVRMAAAPKGSKR